MKTRYKLILSAAFAFVIVVMVLFAICAPSAPMRFGEVYPCAHVEQSAGKTGSDMSDPSHKRITMLRGFAYTLGRRCRAWRKGLRRPSADQ